MLRHKILLIALAFAVAFASCNKMPEHAKYIPKDAMVVVGINTKELSKKIAWDILMGSKLLDEMRAKAPKNGEAAEGLGEAGIDALNTVFFYYMPSFAKGSYHYITAVVPLNDTKKWEAYLQKNFSASIKETGKRKEALLEEDLYAAWNDNMAIVRKAIVTPQYNDDRVVDSFEEDADAYTSQPAETKPDAAKLSADMQAAFTIQKDNDITKDKRFSKLQTNGDDITLWMNYDVLMKNMNNYGGMGMMSGLTLGNSLWKDAAYSAGINLDKGAVHADIKYYVSEEMIKVYSKIGNKNTDRDMIDRLPSQNVNMLVSANISPEGVKAVLEKMGVLGFMSLALSQSSLTADDIFQSFTGDMVMTLSDFSVRQMAETVSNADDFTVQKEDMDMNFLFAMKINNKEKFNKLLSYVKDQGGLSVLDASTYKFAGSEDLFISVDKGFMVIARKTASSKDFMAGTYKSQPKPDVIKKEIYGHPAGAYIDIQSFLNSITVSERSAEQKGVLEESKKIFKDAIINGGENKKEVFTFKAVLNLMNKEENSLLQLLDYSFKVNEIHRHHEKKDDAVVAAAPVEMENAPQN